MEQGAPLDGATGKQDETDIATASRTNCAAEDRCDDGHADPNQSQPAPPSTSTYSDAPGRKATYHIQNRPSFEGRGLHVTDNFLDEVVSTLSCLGWCYGILVAFAPPSTVKLVLSVAFMQTCNNKSVCLVLWLTIVRLRYYAHSDVPSG